MLATADPIGSATTLLLGYGPLGFFVLISLWALYTKRLVSGSELNRVVDQLQDSQAENRRLHALVEEQVLPKIDTQTQVIASLRDILADRKSEKS